MAIPVKNLQESHGNFNLKQHLTNLLGSIQRHSVKFERATMQYILRKFSVAPLKRYKQGILTCTHKPMYNPWIHTYVITIKGIRRYTEEARSLMNILAGALFVR